MTRGEAAQYLIDMCKDCDDHSDTGCLSASGCFEAKQKAIAALYILARVSVRADNCRSCKWYEPQITCGEWGACFHPEWVEKTAPEVHEEGFCYRWESCRQGGTE